MASFWVCGLSSPLAAERWSLCGRWSAIRVAISVGFCWGRGRKAYSVGVGVGLALRAIGPHGRGVLAHDGVLGAGPVALGAAARPVHESGELVVVDL